MKEGTLMERLKKIARLIETTDFDRSSKIIVSLILSTIWLSILTVLSKWWLLFLSQVLSFDFLITVTLPIFGFLYHKLFVLIDVGSSPINLGYSISNEKSKKNKEEARKHKLIFGRTPYINLPMEKERLRSIKRNAEQETFSRVQVVLGDRPSTLELFEEVFGYGKDPRALIVNRLFDMRAATPELKYLYINTSTVDERDLDEIAYQVNRINEIKLYKSSRAIKEGGNAE